MFSAFKKFVVMAIVVLVAMSMLVPAGFCKEMKIGYVDLRKAFYEYEKTKTLESELTALTEQSQGKRNILVEEVTKLRDQAELLSGEKKQKQQEEINKKLTELQEYDRTTRQDLLTKKNDMFRLVIDEIQKIVKDIGTKEQYDYIFDSRNIMYSGEQYDLTNAVLAQLNKK